MNRTESLPMVALRGMTILPEMVAHFDISRERSIEAVQEAMASDQKIFLLTQKDVEVENPGRSRSLPCGNSCDSNRSSNCQSRFCGCLYQQKNGRF